MRKEFINMKILEKYGKKKVIIFTVISGILVILLAVYLALAFFFGSHFWFQTTINGVDCSGKSVEEVEGLITDEIGQYQLTLEEREGQTEIIKSGDISLAPVFDGSLLKELKACNGFAWPVSLFQKTVIEVETMVNYDEEKLAAVLKGLKCFDPANSKAPENAYLSDYINGKGYEIVPEVEGTQVDAAALKEVLHTGIINLQDKISLEEEKCYAEPQIRSDNEALLATMEKINSCVSTVITYEFGNATEVLDGETIHKWLSITEDDEILIDEEQAAEFVKELAEKYNTYGKTRSFSTSYGVTVHLSRNEYGWRIDQSAEKEQLLADIRTGGKVTREPEYRQRAASYGEKDYGNTYVEINLTAQHLFFYKDGAMILESDLVSGNLAKGNGTPSGAFAIYYTQRNAILRGEDYETPVNYWMPFNGGIGLHDGTWRSDFGGNYYKTAGSHGCINLPYSTAKTIFNNVKSGDPVFVYELPGTETAKEMAMDAADAVEITINAIGNVTLDSSGAIGAARTAYDSLNDMAKGYVENYDMLTNAEAVYANLVTEQQAQQAAAQAQTEAQAVVEAIQNIGEVTVEQKKTIEKVRSQYEALSDVAKQYVTNLNVLTDAEAKLQELLDEED